ncbi:MAG TPA: ArsR family transcriptional regulator, partial [Longimicrobiales bacterium]|nr:ArsR family transcriptional regulator [Longimicrobiales bacterium]
MSDEQQEPQKEKTRARVIDLLRRGYQTVDELAAALGLTDNAVRMHLAGLERAGIVHARGVRRRGTAGKPATIYEITPEAEPSFSRAYPPVLAALVDVLSERLGSAELEAILREVGARMGSGQAVPAGTLQKRVKAASLLLNQLGGVTTVEQSNAKHVVLRGAGCPLGVAVQHHPEVCRLVQEMLTELVGVAPTECCQRGDRPSCAFEFS